MYHENNGQTWYSGRGLHGIVGGLTVELPDGTVVADNATVVDLYQTTVRYENMIRITTSHSPESLKREGFTEATVTGNRSGKSQEVLLAPWQV